MIWIVWYLSDGGSLLAGVVDADTMSWANSAAMEQFDLKTGDWFECVQISW